MHFCFLILNASRLKNDFHPINLYALCFEKLTLGFQMLNRAVLKSNLSQIKREPLLPLPLGNPDFFKIRV
jgi:hypothetical protein